LGDCADVGSVTPINAAEARASENIWERMGFLLVEEPHLLAYLIFEAMDAPPCHMDRDRRVKPGDDRMWLRRRSRRSTVALT
jgi:hypothetical protein